jgi:F-type H+-transporting ATPase subunit gamma
LEELLPLYISSKIGNILLSAFTAEHSTRVIAMQEATDNAKDLREDLIILRNKMRQADITGELIEVISSVEALKG